jgi:D-erythronate 2-dehydrogenase
MRVNLDATRSLLEVCRQQARPPKVVFASSVAVFGGALPALVTDATAPTPVSSYGVQKLMGELLVGDYARKGFIDGRAVRLPTIVVRPGKPNAAASSFASGIIREPLAGEAAVCPVEPETALWILSPACASEALVHAHEIPRDAWQAAGRGALNLPGRTVTVAEMLQALREVGGAAAAERVTIAPEAKIKAIVQSWPARFDTARADALGFTRDNDFASIVRAHVQAMGATQ